jgi:hypothetical protein
LKGDCCPSTITLSGDETTCPALDSYIRHLNLKVVANRRADDVKRWLQLSFGGQPSLGAHAGQYIYTALLIMLDPSKRGGAVSP